MSLTTDSRAQLAEANNNTEMQQCSSPQTTDQMAYGFGMRFSSFFNHSLQKDSINLEVSVQVRSLLKHLDETPQHTGFLISSMKLAAFCSGSYICI